MTWQLRSLHRDPAALPLLPPRLYRTIVFYIPLVSLPTLQVYSIFYIPPILCIPLISGLQGSGRHRHACRGRGPHTYKDNMIRPVPSCVLVCHRAKECALFRRAVTHLPLTFWTWDANSFRHCADVHGLLPARRQGFFAQRILQLVNESRRSTL